MHILDRADNVHSLLREPQFDLEEYSSAFRSFAPADFWLAPLEAKDAPLLLDVSALVEREVGDEVLAHLNTYPAVLLFLPPSFSVDCGEWALKVLSLCDRVVGLHRLPLDEGGRSLLHNQLSSFWRQRHERERLRVQMVRFSQEMDELIKSAHMDMHRARKIHEDVVPRRAEDLKGVTLYSKYAVGEGRGSEYFDLLRAQSHTDLVFLHTDSYLVSSCVMGILNKHKAQAGGLDPTSFVADAEAEVRGVNAHKKKPVKAELLLLRLEQGSLRAHGHCFGAFELFSREQGGLALPQGVPLRAADMERARFAFNLGRGEKVVVFSPGFISNWDEARGGQERGAFMAAHPRLTCQELLMEFFYQIKQNSSGDFLNMDATAVMMEVHRHAIQQV